MAIGNALGGSSTSGATSGQGALGGRGNNNAAQRRRQRARARQRRQNNRGNGGGGGGGNTPPAEDSGAIAPNGFDNSAMSSGSLTAPVVPGSSYGGNNPLDTGTGSNNFNDINNRRESALGLLHQAGIDSNESRAYGSNAVPFLNDLVNGWIQDYEGVALTQNPDLTFENFLYGLPGAEALGSAPPPTVTGPAPAAPTPQGFKDWRAENIDGNWKQMNKGRRNRIRNRYETYTTDFAADPANQPVTPGAPGTEAWRNQTWNPAMNAAIRRALARRTPTQRRQDSTRWTGGNTTVAFG